MNKGMGPYEGPTVQTLDSGVLPWTLKVVPLGFWGPFLKIPKLV